MCFALGCVDNKRLDEWVSEDRIDLKKMQYPRKESKINSSVSRSTSRAASPDVVPAVPVSGTGIEGRRSSLIGRKRKVETEVALCSLYIGVHCYKGIEMYAVIRF